MKKSFIKCKCVSVTKLEYCVFSPYSFIFNYSITETQKIVFKLNLKLFMLTLIRRTLVDLNFLIKFDEIDIVHSFITVFVFEMYDKIVRETR